MFLKLFNIYYLAFAGSCKSEKFNLNPIILEKKCKKKIKYCSFTKRNVHHFLLGWFILSNCNVLQYILQIFCMYVCLSVSLSVYIALLCMTSFVAEKLLLNFFGYMESPPFEEKSNQTRMTTSISRSASS